MRKGTHQLCVFRQPVCVCVRRKARTQLAQRPWRVDDLDAFAEKWFAACPQNNAGRHILGTQDAFQLRIFRTQNLCCYLQT